MNLSELVINSNLNFHKHGIVMGSAPSVQLARKIIGKGVLIGVGDLPWRAPDLGPFDFWVTANNIFPIPWKKEHAAIIKKINIPTLISCVSESEQGLLGMTLIQKKDILVKTLDLDNVIPYDSVHIGPLISEVDDPNFCLFNQILNSGKSIQDLLIDSELSKDSTYSTGHTVAIHGFALAVLLNANPIYLCGIEIPKTMHAYRYINNFKRLTYSNESISQYSKRMLKNYIHPIGGNFDTDFANLTHQKIMTDFSIVANLAKLKGINVINLSTTSSLVDIEGIHTVEKV